MKSIDEIQKMLLSELCLNLDKIKQNIDLDYYNELLGDTSFLLAAFLEMQLKSNYEDWASEKWIDDSLLTKVKLDKEKILIWGVIIWGRAQGTEQWTEPFYFETTINSNCTNFIESTFLFADLDHPEITYEEFNLNRSFWDNGYYLDNKWTPLERNWKYILNLKK